MMQLDLLLSSFVSQQTVDSLLKLNSDLACLCKVVYVYNCCTRLVTRMYCSFSCHKLVQAVSVQFLIFHPSQSKFVKQEESKSCTCPTRLARFCQDLFVLSYPNNQGIVLAIIRTQSKELSSVAFKVCKETDFDVTKLPGIKKDFLSAQISLEGGNPSSNVRHLHIRFSYNVSIVQGRS